MPSSKILIVDDDKSLLDLYKSILVDEGYAVEVASSRDQALTLLDTFLPDLILLDCRMGGMSNGEFKKQVEIFQRRSPQTRLIGFSSFSAQSIYADEMRALFGEFSEKPSDLDDFLATVKGLLSSPKT